MHHLQSCRPKLDQNRANFNPSPPAVAPPAPIVAAVDLAHPPVLGWSGPSKYRSPPATCCHWWSPPLQSPLIRGWDLSIVEHQHSNLISLEIDNFIQKLLRYVPLIWNGLSSISIDFSHHKLLNLLVLTHTRQNITPAGTTKSMEYLATLKCFS